jgi:hypothetical protein
MKYSKLNKFKIEKVQVLKKIKFLSVKTKKKNLAGNPRNRKKNEEEQEKNAIAGQNTERSEVNGLVQKSHSLCGTLNRGPQ